MKNKITSIRIINWVSEKKISVTICRGNWTRRYYVSGNFDYISKLLERIPFDRLFAKEIEKDAYWDVYIKPSKIPKGKIVEICLDFFPPKDNDREDYYSHYVTIKRNIRGKIYVKDYPFVSSFSSQRVLNIFKRNNGKLTITRLGEIVIKF